MKQTSRLILSTSPPTHSGGKPPGMAALRCRRRPPCGVTRHRAAGKKLDAKTGPTTSARGTRTRGRSGCNEISKLFYPNHIPSSTNQGQAPWNNSAQVPTMAPLPGNTVSAHRQRARRRDGPVLLRRALLRPENGKMDQRRPRCWRVYPVCAGQRRGEKAQREPAGDGRRV